MAYVCSCPHPGRKHRSFSIKLISDVDDVLYVEKFIVRAACGSVLEVDVHHHFKPSLKFVRSNINPSVRH
jgi:hypothetical protein